MSSHSDSEIVAKTWAIAREVAAAHAADVDKQARFPHETFEALRQARLLTAAVPKELGGGGANMEELAEMCTALASSRWDDAGTPLMGKSLPVYDTDPGLWSALVRAFAACQPAARQRPTV